MVWLVTDTQTVFNFHCRDVIHCVRTYSGVLKPVAGGVAVNDNFANGLEEVTSRLLPYILPLFQTSLQNPFPSYQAEHKLNPGSRGTRQKTHTFNSKLLLAMLARLADSDTRHVTSLLGCHFLREFFSLHVLKRCPCRICVNWAMPSILHLCLHIAPISTQFTAR